jgi:hypothetical protein
MGKASELPAAGTRSHSPAADYEEVAVSSPRARRGIWAGAAVVLCVLAAAGGGYAIGHSGGPNLANAKRTGAHIGATRGFAEGSRSGYKAGYAEARHSAYRAAYKSARRAAYKKALQGATP